MLAPSVPLPDLATFSPVLVVEDEPLLQQRLQEVLCGVGFALEALVFASSLAQARNYLATHQVAFALVDMNLPDGSGIDLIAQMRSQYSELGILVVSAWSSADAVLGALRAGATGYVLKERDNLEVSLAIRSVLRGGAPIDPFIAGRILELLPRSTLLSSAQETAGQNLGLTEREYQVLKLVSDGLSNREIAEKISLSRHTVESHVKHIYRKLAVSSRTSAIKAARELGMID